MQHDAVHTYHWMSSSQFLTALALGQLTPGPVVQTVAVVGYAAGGIGAGLFASLCAFGPSFLFILAGGSHFDQMRSNRRVQAFLTGAGTASVGAIAGSAIPLGLAVAHLWQVGVLVFAAVWLLALRRGVVLGLLVAAGLGWWPPWPRAGLNGLTSGPGDVLTDGADEERRVTFTDGGSRGRGTVRAGR
jgi:chromate transporter